MNTAAASAREPARGPSPEATKLLAQLSARVRRDHEADHFFYDAALRSASVKVLPGEFYVHEGAAADLAITTVLGSCIATCLRDRERRIGGMNHFMLPEVRAGDDGGRYGAYAMELLINELIKRGARKSSLEAKIFGGGAVVQSFTTMNVGERNTDFAVEFLRTERIPIVARDVLDVHARKVCFFPGSGRVLVKRLPSTHASPVATDESRYRRDIAAPVAGSVELF